MLFLRLSCEEFFHYPLQPIRLRCLRRILDRKSTRLNSSHITISYAVFCLKKKKENTYIERHVQIQTHMKENTYEDKDTHTHQHLHEQPDVETSATHARHDDK